jgi:hypothetical protein
LLPRLEQLAKSRQLLRVQKRFDLLVGAIPEGTHLGRWASTARAIGRRTATPAPTASSTTASAASPSTTSTTASASAASSAGALAARIFSEGLHVHRFAGDDPADFVLLCRIEL